MDLPVEYIVYAVIGLAALLGNVLKQRQQEREKQKSAPPARTPAPRTPAEVRRPSAARQTPPQTARRPAPSRPAATMTPSPRDAADATARRPRPPAELRDDRPELRSVPLPPELRPVRIARASPQPPAPPAVVSEPPGRSVFERPASPRPAPRDTASSALLVAVRRQLADRDRLRTAIVLNEVLGAPLALREAPPGAS